MATIRQRANGSWQAIIRRKGWPTESQVFEKKDDAVSWATLTEADMTRGVFIPREKAEQTTLFNILAEHLEKVTPKKKGAKEESYRIAKWQRTKLASMHLTKITGAHLSAVRDKLIEGGLSPSAIHKEFSLLSTVFKWAAREKHLAVSNPVQLVSLPPVRNSRDRRLSAVEERYLMAALENSGCGEIRRNKSMAALVRFAIETAAREGELCDLEWSNVNLKKSTAKLVDTKNGDNRVIPLSPIANSALLSLRGDAERPTGKVFGTTTSAVKQSFRRAKLRTQIQFLKEKGTSVPKFAHIENYDARSRAREQAADKLCADHDNFLVDFRFHDLRHEGTSRLAEIFPIHKLAKITGHKDTRMLLRYYHPRAEDMATELARHYSSNTIC